MGVPSEIRLSEPTQVIILRGRPVGREEAGVGGFHRLREVSALVTRQTEAPGPSAPCTGHTAVGSTLVEPAGVLDSGPSQP